MYAEFDKRNEITDEVVDELLSCSTDKVILQYLKNETTQISSVINNLSEDNENHSMTNILRSQNNNYEEKKNVSIRNYIANDSYISLMEVKSDYGVKNVFEITDEEENNFTRDNWHKINQWDDSQSKKDGDRKFSCTRKTLCGTKDVLNYVSSLGYTCNSRNCTIVLRYVRGKTTGRLAEEKLFTINIDENMKDTHAGRNWENVDGTVIYTFVLTTPLPISWNFNRKHNIVATIKGTWGDDNMQVEHYVKEYSDGVGTIDLPESQWDLLMGLL